jgi:hypothetical protein
MESRGKTPEHPNLQQILTATEVRPSVIVDVVALIDHEVATKSGVSGMAIKSAYKVLRGIRPGMVASSVDALLDQFATQLDPFFQDHIATGEPLAVILDRRRDEMADSLLSITDARAEATSQRALRAAYRKVRGIAAKHVAAAAPGIAELVDKYTEIPDQTSPNSSTS